MNDKSSVTPCSEYRFESTKNYSGFFDSSSSTSSFDSKTYTTIKTSTSISRKKEKALALNERMKRLQNL